MQRQVGWAGLASVLLDAALLLTIYELTRSH
jgi:hypothetical protein